MWALGLSLVLIVATILTGFMWVMLVPAVLVSGWAIATIRPDAKRGQGMAIVSLILCLLAGSCSYFGVSTLHNVLTHLARGVLGDLERERTEAAPTEAPAPAGADEESSDAKPTPVDRWFTKAAVESGVAENVRKRYAAVREKVGAYAGEVLKESLWLGAGPYVAPPTDTEEIGAGIGPKWELDSSQVTYWVRVRCGDEVVHVAFRFAEADEALSGFQQIASGAGPSSKPALLQDVRFFRAGK